MNLPYFFKNNHLIVHMCMQHMSANSNDVHFETQEHFYEPVGYARNGVTLQIVGRIDP